MEVVIEKLDKELAENGVPAVHGEPIRAYLIGKCEEDTAYSLLVMHNAKSLKDCIAFVITSAKAMLKGGSGYLSDEKVFKMVDEYYSTDPVKLAKKAQKIDPVESDEDAPQKKAPAAPSSYTAYKTKKAELTAKPAPKAKPEKPVSDQVSLFDMMG